MRKKVNQIKKKNLRKNKLLKTSFIYPFNAYPKKEDDCQIVCVDTNK